MWGFYSLDLTKTSQQCYSWKHVMNIQSTSEVLYDLLHNLLLSVITSDHVNLIVLASFYLLLWRYLCDSVFLVLCCFISGIVKCFAVSVHYCIWSIWSCVYMGVYLVWGCIWGFMDLNPQNKSITVTKA